MRAPRSLRARIALAAVGAVAICGLLAGALLLAAVEHDGRNQLDNDLRARANSILRRPPDREAYGRGGGAQALLQGSGTFAQVAVGNQVVGRAGDVPDTPPRVPENDGFETVDIGGTPWRSLTFTVAEVGNPRLQVLSSLAPVEERVGRIRRLVLLLGFSAILLTALAAWGFTTLAVRPLARLRAGAARVSGAQDLSTPLPDDGPEEVAQLAGALNEMLARLGASTAATERALEATRRFAADAGHELRTPLTAMRANLDTLARNPGLPPEQRDALVADMTAEQDRMVHLLEGLQALARGEAAESLPREPVELGDVLDAAVHGARKRHPGVRYELAGNVEEGRVDGWEGGLRLIADNLLDNAALHGREAGGSVTVGLARDDGGLVMRVEDDGPGIPAAERERLLEPFARGRDARPDGTGLGLAIVAQQAALHGGELRLGDAPGGGLAVEVRLPASAEEDQA
ncbi:MAG: two-component system, OmpR family, sensor histidine kinase PrrB [Solirubrobacteraceae bacterium]|jgi:signal transduction histidine kinase|nr:two-component system, OmpR family, sensor histidine kinase PrrB [Solirubrobacteraceae bacterium]